MLLGADFIQFQNVTDEIAGSYRVMSSNIVGSGTFLFQLRGNHDDDLYDCLFMKITKQCSY